MAAPAALLQMVVTANTTPANAALGRTQAKLRATGAVASTSSATMKKALVGVGLAAGATALGLFKIGKEFDDAYDKIRVQTGATGKEMQKFRTNFRNVVRDVPADFDTASTAIGELNTRLGLSGGPLTRMTKQMTELSRITETDISGNVETVSRAFVDWEVKTRDQTKALDGFFRLSQESGLAVGDIAEAIQKFGSPLRNLGFTMEEAAAMFANFERAGINTQTMVPGLKLAIGNLVKPSADLAATLKKLGVEGKPDEALRDVFELMSGNTLSDVEKMSLAMEVFGKRAGADMAEAVKQGRFEYEDFIDVMEGGRETIRGAGRETMDFSEHWQMFKNNVLLTLEPLATRVFDAMSGAMEDVTKVLSDPKLSGDEKLDAIAQMTGKAIGLAVEKAIEAAPKIIAGIVKGLAALGSQNSAAISGSIWIAMGAKKGFDALGKKMGKTMGKGIIIGVLLALPSLLADVAQFFTKHRFTIRQAGSDIGEWFVNALIDAVNLGIHGLNETMDELNALAFLGVDAPNIGEIGKVDFEGPIEAQERYNRESNHLWRENLDKAAKTGRDLEDNLKGSSGRTLRALSSDAARQAGVISGKSREGRQNAVEEFGKMARGVVGNVANMVNKASDGLDVFQGNVNEALSAFEVKKVSFSLKKAAAAVATLGRQRGGDIPGSGSGDRVPAMLEAGEYVLNRNAVKGIGKDQLDSINFGKYARFQKGGSAGGLDFALGPYPIPPIQYAADHAGGNSHVHVTGTTTPWVVALGHKLQSMGFMVGEHPAFGGVNAQHSATGGHYDALAIDINSAADETQAEVASIARLLGGSARGLGAVADIARVILQGPDGMLKRGGQGALDTAWKGAKAFVSKQQPTGIAPSGLAGNVPIGPIQQMARQMVAQLWGGGQWGAFNELEMREAGWNPRAVNASSGAAGLAQALPPSKYPPGAWPYQGLSSARLQLQWMMGYIKDRYGTPSGALAWHDAHNWYQKGGQVLNFGNGGTVPGPVGQPQAAIVHGGEHISSGPPAINVIVYATGAEIDVEAEIDGRKAEIADFTIREGGRKLARSRQLAGRGGR